MAQIKTSELPLAESLDYAVGIKDGVTSKAPLSSGSVIYKSAEQKIGKWYNTDLYRKTFIIDTSTLTKDNYTEIEYGFTCKYIMLDYSHSFWYSSGTDEDDDGVEYEWATSSPINCIQPVTMTTTNKSLDTRSQKQVVALYESSMSIYVGANANVMQQLYVTIEYTKASDYQ